MIASVLTTIAKELQKINVPYEFMRWTSSVTYPYFVGEYTEATTDTEDGYGEYDLTITGTTRNTWMELETIREKIENHFPSIGGLRSSTDKGTVVIFYENSFPVPTGEADLKRIQINLHIKVWKGMN